MKKSIISILALTIISVTYGQTLDRSIRPKAGPAPEVKLGKSESFTLPNGMKVFVVENHKLPVIQCSIQLDIKPALEGTMAGYKDMMSELLLSGTKTRSKDKINEELDFVGATVNASGEGIAGSSLTKNEDKLLELMSDIVINSDFKQEELDKVKKRALSGLEAAKNNPDAMVANLKGVLNFGDKHPYGEISTEETVNDITLDRCTEYYKAYFRPNVAYMALVGDITIKEAKKLVQKYFNGWQMADVPSATYSTPTPPSSTRVAFAPREGAVQSVLEVTFPVDLYPGSQDVIKARVANAILGDGSQGRLFLDLREKHAWTYGAYSDLYPNRLGAEFSALVKCRNSVTDSAIAEILTDMNHMKTDKVSPEDLQNTISYISGVFAIGLENSATVAQYAINIERYKMPADYYQNYLKNVAAVTANDVVAMASKYIDPSHANIVVVGNLNEVAPKLEKFGKVSYYDNYGRPITPSMISPAPAGVTADGVLKKYVEAIGGEKVIKGIKDITKVSSGEIQGHVLTITEMKKSPSKMKLVVESGGIVFQKQVLNGEKGYSEQQGKKQDLAGDDLQDLTQEADLYALLHPAKYGDIYTLKGVEKVNGSDAYVLTDTTAKGKAEVNYYDVKTGFLVKDEKYIVAGTSVITQIEEFSDFKPAEGSGGYILPYTFKQTVGQQVITTKLEKIEINKGIKDSEFE